MNDKLKPILSIVIVSYNVKDFLLDCLHSINEFIKVPFEIIVIDNSSADNTCQSIKEKFPNVKLIENKTNLGFSAANNIGFAVAEGEYLLMLNPDAVLIDSTLEKVLDFLKNNRVKQVIIGPKISNPDRSFQNSAWKFPKLRQHFLESIFLNKLIDITTYSNINSEKERLPVDFLSGAALLMTKQTQQDIGNLDENLFWMEDVDFCYRNRKRGGEALYFPDWQILHHIGQSSKKNKGMVIANQLISKLKFYKKHKLSFKFFTSIFIFQWHIFLRILISLPSLGIGENYLAKTLRAYLYTQKRFLKYLFLSDQRLN